jgi:hypothetical protein
MIEALIAGETNPAKLVLADPRVKASPHELREAIRGRVTMPPWLRSMRKWRTALGLSHRSRVDYVDPRHHEPQRVSHRLRDRHRYEPVPFGRTSHLVGLHMSAQ